MNCKREFSAVAFHVSSWLLIIPFSDQYNPHDYIVGHTTNKSSSYLTLSSSSCARRKAIAVMLLHRYRSLTFSIRSVGDFFYATVLDRSWLFFLFHLPLHLFQFLFPVVMMLSSPPLLIVCPVNDDSFSYRFNYFLHLMYSLMLFWTFF